MITSQCTKWSNSETAAVYDAAADHFDAPPLDFWNRHGSATVRALNLERGASILDVGCGAGASAIPAAIAVGRTGEVLGIDVAGRLLALGWRKASRAGLKQLRFQLADMTDTGFANASFDAVISVFSIFFAEQMAAVTAELWRMVKPGGQLAITTWGPEAFQPGARIFAEELLRVESAHVSPQSPWARLCEPAHIIGLFESAGATTPTIERVIEQQPLRCPEDWWTIVLGSGFRGAVESLSPEKCLLLRDAINERVDAEGIEAIDTSALHALARKPMDSV